MELSWRYTQLPNLTIKEVHHANWVRIALFGVLTVAKVR